MDHELIIKIYDWIGLFFFISALISSLFWVVFAWVTMRKLRKNIEIKEHLGMEFISGYNAFNVSHALVFGKHIKEEDKKPFDIAFDADLTLIYKHTTKTDRVLGRIFCLSGVVSLLLLVPMAFIDFFIN